MVTIGAVLRSGVPVMLTGMGGAEREARRREWQRSRYPVELDRVERPKSFWLPTASDKFYPDFVGQLTDGRLFVVEYKGALLAGAGVDDTNEKRTIGRLWESRSNGKRLFIVVEREIAGHDMRAQMLDKIG
jgi:hypothetical protein